MGVQLAKSVLEHRHCIRHLAKARESLLKELGRGGENNSNSWMNKEGSLGGKDRGVFIS